MPVISNSVTNYPQTDRYSINEEIPFSRVTDDEHLLDASFTKSDVEHIGQSSAWRASYNIICTVVGTGLLQLPYALNQSGWIGVIMLLMMAMMATYTAVILIKCMNPPNNNNQRLRTYGDVGYRAYGLIGMIVVEIMIHLTLVGVATIYLLLAGQNISQLLSQIPTHDSYCSLIDINYRYVAIGVAAVLWFHVWMKTLHEVGLLSMFNVMVAIYLLVVVLVEVFLNHDNWHTKGTQFVNSNILDLGGAFASFAFSYGAHAVLPSVYETMAHKESYNRMIIITFGTILLFYLPLAISGYAAFGSITTTPIYNNLCTSGCSLAEKYGVLSAIVAITVHIMFSYAIVLNPTELALERALKIDSRPNSKLWSVLLRTGMVLLTLGIGEAIPFFGPLLDLVSAVTNSFTSFVLPCVFYMKLYWGRIGYVEIGWNVLIIIFALCGFAFGGFDALQEIACALLKNHDSVFGIACSSSSSTSFPSC